MPTRLKLYLGLFVVFLISGTIPGLWGCGGHPAWLREAAKLRHGAPVALTAADDLSRLPSGDILLSEVIRTVPEGVWFPGFKPPYEDMWRKPYRFVRMSEGGTSRLGVYSTGADGLSASHGNDPDDLNSWSENGRSYYENQDRVRVIRSLLMDALYFAGLAVLVSEFFLAIGRANRRWAQSC